jgi:hypothetical protein
LDFETGSYTLPIQILDPGQEVTIDIRRLRDTRTPDSIGRVIPREVTSGQATWHEHGPQALIGRLEEFDVGAGVASSFSCPGPGCCISTDNVECDPGSMTGPVGETGYVKLLETTVLDCNGATYGPFDVSADATWSSTNTSVVTVGSVTSSGVLCTCVGAGQANIHADFLGTVSEPDPLGSGCDTTSVPFPGDCPIDVNPPALVGPGSVTRAASATFTIQDAGTNAQISGWQFSDGTSTVSRTVSTSATTWSGIMVTSGTVSVTIVQGGVPFNLSTNVTVSARTGFAFTAIAATKVQNGFNCPISGVISVPSPPTQSGDAVGKFCLDQAFSFTFSSVGDNGPNQGFRYVLSVFNHSPTAITACSYVISPDLEDSGSTFFLAQCGNYNAQTNPNGFISGANLLADTTRHEAGTVQSHFNNYVQAQNNAANNLGVVGETRTGKPSDTESTFKDAVTSALNDAIARILTATQVEPCSVQQDANCVPQGFINFPPYQPCN